MGNHSPRNAERAMRVVIALSLLLAFTTPAAAQRRQPPPPRQPSPRDTITVNPFRVKPPVSPLGAFWRSMLLPGWGQAALDRKVTGAVFVFWEGVTLTMTLKSIHQKSVLERTGSEERLDSKKQEIQDWAVLLAFNHLLAGAEAFVSANFWDFPGDLEARPLGDGRVGIGARINFK